MVEDEGDFASPDSEDSEDTATSGGYTVEDHHN
jgi:hypothetical protein